jgi:hypothetical protein
LHINISSGKFAQTTGGDSIMGGVLGEKTKSIIRGGVDGDAMGGGGGVVVVVVVVVVNGGITVNLLKKTGFPSELL